MLCVSEVAASLTESRFFPSSSIMSFIFFSILFTNKGSAIVFFLKNLFLMFLVGAVSPFFE